MPADRSLRAPDDTPFSGWWWLSFVDPDRAPGTAFLGAAIVPGRGMADAVQAAWEAECNPGGEVQGHPIEVGLLPSDPWRNRLLSKGDALEIGSWIRERARVEDARPARRMVYVRRGEGRADG